MASKRIPLVAGNWKMNFDHLEATYFVQKLVWLLRDAHFDFKRCEVALFPSFTSLRSVQVLVEADKLHVAYGAQSVSVTTQGAFTGDVSADMIAHLGCSYVIVGHSERRKYHPEDDANIVDQVRAVLAAGIISGHPFGLLHQLPGTDALTGRIVAHNKNCLFKKALIG